MGFEIIKDFQITDTPHSLSTEVIDYGVRMVGAPLEWNETQGEKIKVGIIDTGIDLDHEDLKGRVVEYYNFTPGDSKNVYDENGHSTHVAGIIAANKNGIGVVGVAPKCDLYIAKAFDKDGRAETKNIVNAMRWLASKGVGIINMSFSNKNFNSDFEYTIKKFYSQGIICICAAGNDGAGKDTIEYPAKFPETISVTAVDIHKKITDFSSTGERADVAAPGKNILSTYPKNMYITLSGTSMAAPLITGSVALIQAKARNRFGRYLKPAEVKLILDMYTDDLGILGKDEKYGYGVFTFGRIGANEALNPRTSIRSNSSHSSSNATHSSLNISSWKAFNNTLLLKLMGFGL